MNNERVKPFISEQEIKMLITLTETGHRAIAQAVKSHRYHRRDDGKGYLEQHVFPLTLEIFTYFQRQGRFNDDLVIATLLHDVPEDDPTCPLSRIEKEYGKNVACIVESLHKKPKLTQIRTQQDKHEEHVAFLARLKCSPFEVKIIKLLDRLNNAVCTDALRNKEKYARFIQDTEELYIPLAEETDKDISTKLINEITRLKEELHT